MGCFHMVLDRVLFCLRVHGGTGIGCRAYSQCATLSIECTIVPHASTPNKHAIHDEELGFTREKFDR